MRAFLVDNEKAEQVQSMLIDNNINFKQYEDECAAFVGEYLETAIKIHPDYKNVSSAVIQENIDMILENHREEMDNIILGYVDGIIEESNK